MGKLSLDAFEDWLVPESWNMFKDSSPEAIDLVSSIHLLLSERDDRVLNKSNLRKELLSLLNNVSLVISDSELYVNPLPERFSASKPYWVNPGQPGAFLTVSA